MSKEQWSPTMTFCLILLRENMFHKSFQYPWGWYIHKNFMTSISRPLPSLPDANRPIVTPWNARPTRRKETLHIIQCAGDWQEHIFIWQLNGKADECLLPCVCPCVIILLGRPLFFFSHVGGRMCTWLTKRPTARKLLPSWTQSRESISGKAWRVSA